MNTKKLPEEKTFREAFLCRKLDKPMVKASNLRAFFNKPQLATSSFMGFLNKLRLTCSDNPPLGQGTCPSVPQQGKNQSEKSFIKPLKDFSSVAKKHFSADNHQPTESILHCTQGDSRRHWCCLPFFRLDKSNTSYHLSVSSRIPSRP